MRVRAEEEIGMDGQPPGIVCKTASGPGPYGIDPLLAIL